MIAWTPSFPVSERPLGYWRLLKARRRYWENWSIGLDGWRPRLLKSDGYQNRIAALRDKHKGRRCFIISNGPGLKDLDLTMLKDEITIGCNGIYRAFGDWGFHTEFLVFEDIEQLELRRADIAGIRGPTKMAALYNAYAFSADEQTLFFNAPRMKSQAYYWTSIYPQFSFDFASVVHLGGTVTYIMLQLALHLGCDPVYLIGLDHDYGALPKLFPPGKITITEENIHLVRGLHFSDRYYKVGDQIGVPFVAKQEQAYALARRSFESVRRRVLNASSRTKLDVFDRVDYASLFCPKPSVLRPMVGADVPASTVKSPEENLLSDERVDTFLFDAAPVDAVWLAKFSQANTAPEWLGRCERVVATRYSANSASRDGYSRIAWALAQGGRHEMARPLFERDRALGRMRRWQFLRYVETLLLSGDEPAAQALVEEYYASHPDARDGWAALGAHAVRAKDAMRGRELLRRDHALGRLSPILILRLARLEAEAGALDAAESLVTEAYAADATLRNGFLGIGEAAYRAGHVSSLKHYLAQEVSTGRTTREARIRGLETIGASDAHLGQLGLLVRGLARWLTDEGQRALASLVADDASVRLSALEVIKRVAVRDGVLELDGGVLTFVDEHSLQIVIEEILIFENYWFTTADTRPTIIDAGANFGLATYYFRKIQPNATILAFEPDPRMASILRGNVERNGWSNVRVIEAALAREPGRAVFHSTPAHTMAGSLTTRMVDKGAAHAEHEVECRRLSEFLAGPVDYLKLDIEGAEVEVLEEATPLLGNVRHLFCEYHRRPGHGHEGLCSILRTIETSGFRVELAGPSRLAPGGDRGIEHVRGRSTQIWATRG